MVHLLRIALRPGRYGELPEKQSRWYAVTNAEREQFLNLSSSPSPVPLTIADYDYSTLAILHPELTKRSV